MQKLGAVGVIAFKNGDFGDDAIDSKTIEGVWVDTVDEFDFAQINDINCDVPAVIRQGLAAAEVFAQEGKSTTGTPFTIRKSLPSSVPSRMTPTSWCDRHHKAAQGCA
ncbi:hypothetical protein Q4543_12240 [Salipiger sp. 1_MG-2023]|uniref:hypothetical protein n=1 Tax=Salipiger sp. 1_MG-2023 TaxID=3062665 RepID=UPI0026E24BE2|nr:hypothetical protein [Salipiger sp. 1_MG-2023]MDO6586283.1 hypothetical protein [Salipiger sp. 1_MG-2023]